MRYFYRSGIELWLNLGYFGPFIGPTIIFALNQPIQIIFL